MRQIYTTGYDIDGTITEGDLTPEKDSVIITGRSEDQEDTQELLDSFGFGKLPIYFANGEDPGEFKARMIKELGIKKFYEDDIRQAEMIQQENPNVEIVLVKKKFIIVTKDYSGLGWVHILQRSDNPVILAYKNDDLEPEDQEAFDKVGEGMIDKLPLDEVFKNRKDYKSWYFIWDGNHNSEESDKLREEGFKVWGGSSMQDQMEHDRELGVQAHEMYGLSIPTTEEFTSIDGGLRFLDENEDKAYVFKPDGSDQSHLTFVPSAHKAEVANRELYDYLESLDFNGTYILQEKLKGIEANFEVWFYQGTPFFAFCGLECKKKLNGDYGENVGCAHDLVFTVPLYSRGVMETVGKVFPFYQEKNYTGPADINVIIADKEVYFLEVCNRFGYNAHPNLFMSLANKPFAEIMADWINGRTENMYDNFKYGFGASISLYIDHKRGGLPLFIDEDMIDKFFCYDCYLDGDKLRLAGYDNQVGIVAGQGYTIQDAAEEAMEHARKITFPDKALRSDFCEKDYPGSIIKRYEALRAIKFVE